MSESDAHSGGGSDAGSGYTSDGGAAKKPRWKISQGRNSVGDRPSDAQVPPDDPTPSTFATHRSDFITASIVVAVIGLLLTFIGWTRPTTVEKAEQTKSTHTMTFDYTANVPPSPAYQTTEVRAPDPVFRKQTNLVQVEFAYKGEPATVTPEVRLSTSNGWRWTLPPGAQVDASSGEGAGMVTLDLNALQAQAEAGAAAAGIPASDLTITVIPTATTSAGDFKPELPLKLSTQSLTLADGEESLVADESKDASTLSVQPNSVTFLGMSIGVWPMRILGLLLLVGGVVAWLALQRRRPAPGVADMAAVHRHRELIIKVAAVDEHGMCIDVADLDSLVRLAKRYALMILQVEGGAGGAGDMYYVQDESVTYRWTPGGLAQGGGWGGNDHGAGGPGGPGGPGGEGFAGGLGAPGSSSGPSSRPTASQGGAESPNQPASPPPRTPTGGALPQPPAVGEPSHMPTRDVPQGMSPNQPASPPPRTPTGGALPQPPAVGEPSHMPTRDVPPGMSPSVTGGLPPAPASGVPPVPATGQPNASGGPPSASPLPEAPGGIRPPETPSQASARPPSGRVPQAPWPPASSESQSATPPRTAPFAAPPPAGPPIAGPVPEEPPR